MKNSGWKIIPFLLLLVISAAAFCKEEDPEVIYLTWTKQPESTMVICWLTDQGQHQDTIEFCKECDQMWHRAEGAHSALPNDAPYLLHSIELTHLDPESLYLFRIPPNGKIHKFQTMPTSSEMGIRFVVGGDMYHDTIDLVHATNQAAAKTGPMFVVVGGDIAYASSKKSSFLPSWSQSMFSKLINQKFDRWLEWLKAWKEDMVTPDGRMIPMVPVIGNHDVVGGFDQTPAEAPFFFALFPLPGIPGYNLLDFGDYMTLFLLDSGHVNPVAGRQCEWLDARLGERAYIPHKFAIYHVPAYPSIRDFKDEKCCEVRKCWPPIFDKHHLAAAFEHHDHDYKRSHPLTGGKPTAGGVYYIGDGAWGVDEPRKLKKKPPAPYIAKMLCSRHFLLVTLSGNQRSVSSIAPDGALLDEISWGERSAARFFTDNQW